MLDPSILISPWNLAVPDAVSVSLFGPQETVRRTIVKIGNTLRCKNFIVSVVEIPAKVLGLNSIPRGPMLSLC